MNKGLRKVKDLELNQVHIANKCDSLGFDPGSSFVTLAKTFFFLT